MARQKMLTSTTRSNRKSVQSCITNVSFPETLELVEAMVKKNSELPDGGTDIDMLLEFKPEYYLTWTAPRWMTAGDILFFYHTAKAATRVNRLLREATVNRKYRHLRAVLEHAESQATQYSRTIFGCARVAGESGFEADEEHWQHFQSRIFAPLDTVSIFDQPLTDQQFTKFITLSPGGTLTPLHGTQFTRLKSALAKGNTLPAFFRKALPGKGGFRTVTSKNWDKVACASDCRFIDESQMRVYFVDYFLSEIKDSRTPLLEECSCFRNEARTGIADYFVQIDSKWIPVEVKLNIEVERNLSAQIRKYTRIDEVAPRKGAKSQQRFQTSRHKYCLVIDHLGLYLLSDGKFIDCNSGKPMYRRKDMGKSRLSEIKRVLRSKMRE